MSTSKKRQLGAGLQHVVDPQLIDSLKTGDHSAFQAVYSLYKDGVYSLCLGMLGNAEDAAEAAQHSFVKLWNSRETYDHKSSFTTWLYRLCLNTCYDSLRGRKRRPQFIEEVSEQMPTSDTETTGDVLLEREVWRAVHSLGTKLRSVIVLKYIEDLSYSQIGEVLGCSLGTVSSRLNRGLTLLSKRLQHLKQGM